MLFNSYLFLFAFLPVTMAGFFLLGRLGRRAGASWLALASLFFYGWWDDRYLALLLTSIVGNYLAGRWLAKWALTRAGVRLLTLAIVSNVGLLAYYKYADFFIGAGNALWGTEWDMLKVVLPIGISFFTFTQIAFLVDAYLGKVEETRFSYYLLFVTYFPHLIAGPVLHHKEMMPQFDERRNYSPSMSNMAIGMTIFVIGLAKKVLIADNLAVYANPVFDSNAAPSFFQAWGGALSYTFQLYFDFSGYSDMAIGLSRMFGVKLPLNFNSPYKARNISEFWRCWHMTLSRFLRDYLYIPLGGNRCGAVRRQFNLMVTMLLGGLWHGAGWNFVIWGGLHGAYLVIHQLFRKVCERVPVRLPYGLGAGLGRLLTFVAVVFAWVYFRAPDLEVANRIVMGMLGGHGASLPELVLLKLGGGGAWLQEQGVRVHLGGGAVFVEAWAWIAAGAAIAFLAPSTQQIMAHHEPTLLGQERLSKPAMGALAWFPRRRHAIVIGLLFSVGVMSLSRPTEFLYFQF